MRYDFDVKVPGKKLPIDNTLVGSYSEFVSIYVNGVLQRPGFDLYNINDNQIEFMYDLALGDMVTIIGNLDIFLFENIASCSREDLALYLTSDNKAERQLATIQVKHIKRQEEFIKQIVREQIDAALSSKTSN